MHFQLVRSRSVQMARRVRKAFPQKLPSLTAGKAVAMLALLFVVSSMLVTPRGFAAASDISFDIDFTPLFSNISTWVGTLMPVYSIPIAITIAVAIIIVSFCLFSIALSISTHPPRPASMVYARASADGRAATGGRPYDPDGRIVDRALFDGRAATAGRPYGPG